MSKRIGLSKRSRFDVFKRDGFCCQYCGKHPPEAVLEVDHIVPVAGGGTNDEGNLVTSCFECNRGKAANSLKAIPRSLAEQGAEIREREEQLAGYREILKARADRIEDDMWMVADALFKDAGTKGVKRDWLRSIKQFNEKLGLYEVLEAADIAWAKNAYSEFGRWKYFCGICWTKIREGANGSHS